MSDDVPTTYGQELWLIFYDLQSENSKGLTPEQKAWLRNKRVDVWYKLRWIHNCVPLNMSVWLIRDAQEQEKLQNKKTEWIEAYSQKGFYAHISIFPIKTTDEGYTSFKKMEFDFCLEWLGKLDKALTKAVEKGEGLNKKNIQAHQKKFELLSRIIYEDFDRTYPDWNEAIDTLNALDQKIHIAQGNI